ncbi:MAG: autotransporter domain-containing protein, partial [Planctomycetaceae bacterium]|nr:autotransporter domain-containing protein [Planctomycetaceae bacterium]
FTDGDRWLDNCEFHPLSHGFFVGPIAQNVYNDGKAVTQKIPLNSAENPSDNVNYGCDPAHFDVWKGLSTHQDYRNYSGDMEVELAALNDIGYNIDLRNFFGRSIYTSNNTITNTQGYFARNAAGTAYIDGRENLATYGLGLHIFGDNNDVTQNANLLANGEAGAGIRTDGFDTTLRINPNVTVTANGDRGDGLLVAYGTGTKIVHRGDLQATGNGGIAARFDFGQNSLGYLNDVDTENHYSHNPNISYLNAALVDKFDITGSLNGESAAIYIADTAHVAEINVMSGASINGDIISDYGYSTYTTNLTFGKQANTAGESTVGADTNFGFTINDAILGDNGTHADGRINLEFVGGKTTVGENANVSVNNVMLNQGTTLALENNVNVAGDFAMTDATIGFNASIDPTIRVAGDADLQGTNILDIIQFSNGTYTIIDANTLANKTEFDTVTIGGHAKRDRHQIAWNSTADDVKVTLSAQNIASTWKGGNGNWDAGTENWRNSSNANEIFIGGDSVSFNAGEGTVNVVAAANPADMTVTNGAKYRYNGENIHVAKGTSTITEATGTLTVDDNAEARFAQNVTATNLVVDNGLFGIEKNVNVTNNAQFTDADLEIQTNDNTSAQIVVGGTATVDDGTVSFNGTQRRGIKYTFLTANNLTVTDEFELGTLSSGFRGDLGYADGTSGSYWLQMAEKAVEFSPIGQRHNQKRLGGYLDIISPNVPFGDLNDVLGVLDDLVLGNPVAARYALDQMSGSIYGTHASTSIMNIGIVNNTLADVLRNSYSKKTDTECNPCDEISTNCEPCEPCEPCADACEPICTKKSYKRNLWGLGYGIGGASQFDGNTYGYSQSFGGTIIGVDRESKRKTRFGGYFSYGEGRISSDLLDRSELHEFLAGIYYRKNLYQGYVLASAGLGNVQYDTQRTISFVGRRATSKHDAFVGTIYAERGFDFATALGRLQPYLGIQYIGNRQDRFTETGAGDLNLIGQRTETDSVRSLLGTRFQSKVRRYNGGRLNANANIAWLHEYADSSTSFTANLVGNPVPNTNFTVRGNDTKRDWLILGVGLNYEKKPIRLFGGYDAYVNNQQILHTGNAGLTYSW